MSYSNSVYADKLMIRIIIRNVINNAIKFRYEDCEINITVTYQKDNTRLICIKDNGVGIPKNVINKLFCEENISAIGTLNEKGIGLGLLL